MFLANLHETITECVTVFDNALIDLCARIGDTDDTCAAMYGSVTGVRFVASCVRQRLHSIMSLVEAVLVLFAGVTMTRVCVCGYVLHATVSTDCH
jgi:hypothetical protein